MGLPGILNIDDPEDGIRHPSLVQFNRQTRKAEQKMRAITTREPLQDYCESFGVWHVYSAGLEYYL